MGMTVSAHLLSDWGALRCMLLNHGNKHVDANLMKQYNYTMGCNGLCCTALYTAEPCRSQIGFVNYYYDYYYVFLFYFI